MRSKLECAIQHNHALSTAEPLFLRINIKLETYFELSSVARSKSLDNTSRLISQSSKISVLTLLEIMS